MTQDLKKEVARLVKRYGDLRAGLAETIIENDFTNMALFCHDLTEVRAVLSEYLGEEF